MFLFLSISFFFILFDWAVHCCGYLDALPFAVVAFPVDLSVIGGSDADADAVVVYCRYLMSYFIVVLHALAQPLSISVSF